MRSRATEQAAETVTLDEADQIECMLDDFNRALLHGEAVRPAPDEAVKTLRVLDALALSARGGPARGRVKGALLTPPALVAARPTRGYNRP